MPAVDWQTIGYDGPPIAGDPGATATLASNLVAVADTIDDQLARLTGVDAAEIWDSEAAVGFHEARAELPDLLGRVGTRYRDAGGVLETYARDLGDAVADMEWWGCAAVEARETLDAATRNLETRRAYEQEARDEVDRWNQENPDQPAVAPASTLGQYEQAVADAQEELDRALANIDDAVAAKNAAGDRAAEALAEVNDDDLRNSWNPFRSIGQWLSRTLDLPAWSDLLRTVASVVSIAALLLCWVPVLGPILGATALVLNVMMLLVDLTLVASGEGSWTDVAFDTLGVLTGGFGRAASVGARAAQQTYRATRGVQIARGARQFFPGYTSSGSPLAAAWAHARNPVANFSEVADHLRIVRTGRDVPLALGGHNPGYWNAFAANARTHGRNLIGHGGPAAAAFVWGDAGRRLFFPTGNTPNPGTAFDRFESHHERDRGADHSGTVDPTAPYADTPAPPDAGPDCQECDPELPEPERPEWEPEPRDEAPEPPAEPEPRDEAPEPPRDEAPEPPTEQPEPPRDEAPEPPTEPEPPRDEVPEPPGDPEPPCEQPEPPRDEAPQPPCEQPEPPRDEVPQPPPGDPEPPGRPEPPCEQPEPPRDEAPQPPGDPEPRCQQPGVPRDEVPQPPPGQPEPPAAPEPPCEPAPPRDGAAEPPVTERPEHPEPPGAHDHRPDPSDPVSPAGLPHREHAGSVPAPGGAAPGISPVDVAGPGGPASPPAPADEITLDLPALADGTSIGEVDGGSGEGDRPEPARPLAVDEAVAVAVGGGATLAAVGIAVRRAGRRERPSPDGSPVDDAAGERQPAAAR